MERGANLILDTTCEMMTGMSECVVFVMIDWEGSGSLERECACV